MLYDCLFLYLIAGKQEEQSEEGSSKRSMVPMTKEQYDKEESKVRRVYDPDTGRNRYVPWRCVVYSGPCCTKLTIDGNFAINGNYHGNLDFDWLLSPVNAIVAIDG